MLVSQEGGSPPLPVSFKSNGYVMSDFDLELQQLTKVYPGGTLAVEAFDLQVKKGEFISFVGPSGCGKTTTLRMIAGLEDITDGRLLIRGNDYTRVDAEHRPTSTIFQNYAIFPHMTVRQNIGFGLDIRKVEAAEKKRRVDEIMEKLELVDVAEATEPSLSGGQKQRLALARGLITEPEILLLDEPLGALDVNLRKSIQEELKLLQRSLNITFIFVTHAQSEALSMADRVVVMNAGRVEQISDPYDLYTRPQSPFVARFIGRNNLFAGKIAGTNNGRAAVETEFGVLEGVPGTDQARLAPGKDAMVVVPSEYIDILPEGMAPDKDEHHSIGGVLTAIDAVGQLAYPSVRLDQGREIRLEANRSMLAGRGLEEGGRISLNWDPARATIVENDGQSV